MALYVFQKTIFSFINGHKKHINTDIKTETIMTPTPSFCFKFKTIHIRNSETNKHGRNHNGEFKLQYPSNISKTGLAAPNCEEISNGKIFLTIPYIQILIKDHT